jgi:benzoyl-CoA reductase/2-hydroxyglutaryl-CoA dehydratase subunit BcrC/BadD/HgdB
VAVLENLAGRYGKNMFTLHIPQDESGNHVKNLAGQIRDLSKFVERETGCAADPEKLRKAVENTNDIRRIMAEIYDLARTVPTPLNSRDLANFGIVMALFLGTDAGVSVAEAFREDLRNRVDRGESGVPGEKFRLLWIQNRIQFKHPLETLLAEDYKAVVAVDELNDITWEPIDPDDMFGGMARRSISIPFNGTLEKRVDHLRKLALDYKIDGAINPCNWGCRQGAGARGLIEKGLKDIGVPVLNLEVDCVDSRKFTEGQFRTRIEAFMEMMS